VEYRTIYFGETSATPTLNYEVNVYENGSPAFDYTYGLVNSTITTGRITSIGVQQNTTLFTQFACDPTGQSPPVATGQKLTATLQACGSPTPTATPTKATATTDTAPPPVGVPSSVPVEPTATTADGADWWCTGCALRRPAPQWRVEGDAVIDPAGRAHVIQLQLPGRVNRANAATALAVAAEFGVDPGLAAPRLAQVVSIAGRYAQVHRDGRDIRLLLAKNPAKITMGEVVRHFDGILAPIDCVSVAGYKRCSQESVCRFRRVFLDIRNYVAGVMDRSTLADVAKVLPVSKQELSGVFVGGEGI